MSLSGATYFEFLFGRFGGGTISTFSPHKDFGIITKSGVSNPVSSPLPQWDCQVNTDGTYCFSVKHACAGGVIHDSNGHWIRTFVFSIRRCSMMNAEICTIYEGLQLA